MYFFIYYQGGAISFFGPGGIRTRNFNMLCRWVSIYHTTGPQICFNDKTTYTAATEHKADQARFEPTFSGREPDMLPLHYWPVKKY